MTPETLSASSIAVFEACEARFKAEYIDRGRMPSGGAADLGTVAHEVCELAVNQWVTHEPGKRSVITDNFTLHNLQKAFETTARSYSLAEDQIKEGKKMMKVWYDHHAEAGFEEVLCTELKETFTLTHSILGEIPVTYIWDRGGRIISDDPRDNGDIKVVDYKTFIRPVTAESLMRKGQPRLYALAAMIKYKDQLREGGVIWVEYWLLRFGPVGMRFTREDNLATWHYLRDVWARINASDGTKETINNECQYCVRKGVCETLKRHSDVGGVIGMEPGEQVLVLGQTRNAIKALKRLEEEVLTQIEDAMEEAGTTEITGPAGRAWLKVGSKREADPERVAKVIGPEITAKYASLGVGAIDTILKEEPLTDEQKAELKGLMRSKPTSRLEVELVSPFDDL